MIFLEGQKYRIVFQVGNNALSFICTIIKDTEDFVTFSDKFGKELMYRKSNVISVEELGQ